MSRFARLPWILAALLALAAGVLVPDHVRQSHATAFSSPAIPSRAFDWATYQQFNPGDGTLAVAQPGVSGSSLLVGRAQVYLVAGTGNAQSAVVALSESAAPSRVLWASLIGVKGVVNDVGEAEDDVDVAAAPGVGVTLQVANLTLQAGNYAIVYLAGWDV